MDIPHMKYQHGNAYGRMIIKRTPSSGSIGNLRPPMGQITKDGPIEIRYFSDVAKLLASGTEISDPTIWQKIAIVCSQSFEEMSAHQSPLSGIRALAMCADQHIKAKVLQLKGVSGATKGLDELRRKIDEAIHAPELNSAQADEGWDDENG